MIQILVISLVAVIVLHDSLGAELAAMEPESWLVALGPMAAVALVTHVFILWCGRQLDHTGRGKHIANAERVLDLSRWTIAGLHAWNVLAGGWLERVRGMMGGDIVAADELLAITPPIVALAMGWASYYGIDRRLREASLMGILDQGSPVRSLPSRLEYVSDQLRHQVLLILVPMLLVLSWTEGMDKLYHFAARRWPSLGHWLNDSAWGPWVLTIGHFAGIVAILMMMPLALRYLWRTVPLGPGVIRERLRMLCERQGVRCRDFLVWRTHTDMVNGALVGVLPRMRYILLTDALLERLDERQVEAVMAHEVAHARRHHIPWLLAVVIASVGLSDAAIGWVLGAVMPAAARETWLEKAGLGLAFPVALAMGLVMFGWVSRRFEQQADAFATQHLSGFEAARGAKRDASLKISEEAASAMSGALGKVARLAHMPEMKFSFRHGSIASRRRNIARLVGTPAARTPVDGVVQRIKLAAALSLMVMIGLAFL